MDVSNIEFEFEPMSFFCLLDRNIHGRPCLLFSFIRKRSFAISYGSK